MIVADDEPADLGGRVTDPAWERGQRPAFTAARPHLGVAVLLLVTAAAAWWSTAVRMDGMDAGPGSSLGTLGGFTGVWVVMMAAMMLPSLVPTASVYTTLVRRRAPSRWLAFAGGYLLAWGAAGVAAYELFELGNALFGGGLAWDRGGRWLSAGVLALAAVYQLTPLKDACLAKCRNPQRVWARSWREGWSGALVMGVRCGGWCIGCSWALMTALFALGVMSLTWMARVALLVAFEKIGPSPRAGTVATATVLLALAVGILAVPRYVPGLVIPGSAGAMRAMKTMH